jgi:tetratricopeptide (TPR) repeat protein
VSLGLAHLLEDNPRAANAVLLENREHLRNARFAPPAALVGAYARYSMVAERKQRERQAADLLAAILATRGDTVLGVAGQWLAGMAYADLGMPEQMAEVLERALPLARRQLAGEMSFALANYWYNTGQRAKANLLYDSLAGTKTPLAAKAKLRLAEAALEDNNPDDCLQRCHAILSDDPPADATVVLTLMGKAFERKGNFRQAADCFAGRIPPR